MGGGEDVVVLAPVLEAEHVVAVVHPAPGRLVGLGRQQRGEVDLLGAGGVHLLADDLLDPAQHGEAERQPGVDARGGAADVPGAVQQLVAGDLGVDRVLLEGAHEQR